MSGHSSLFGGERDSSRAASTEGDIDLKLIALPQVEAGGETELSSEFTDEPISISHQNTFGNNAPEESSPSSHSSDEDEHSAGFLGLASTWRHLTADVRDQATDLEQSRQRDLSIQLFKASQNRLLDKPLPSSKSNQREHTSIQTWTAWPMPPDTVPRSTEENQNWDHSLGSKREYISSQTLDNEQRRSSSLEACLLAIITRHARHSLAARESDLRTDRESEIHAERTNTAGPVLLKPRKRRRSSDARIEYSTPTRGALSQLDLLIPVPSADDDSSQVISQSAVRQIISNIDRLLLQAHERQRDPSLKSRRKSKESPQSPGKRMQSEPVKIAPGTDDESLITYDSDNVDPTPPTNRDHRTEIPAVHLSRRKSKKPKLAGWQDLLSQASRTGDWPAATIERAVHRCQELFGGDKHVALQTDAGMQRYDSGDVRDQVAQSSGVQENVHSGGEDDVLQTFPCPVILCNRRRKPFHKPDELVAHVEGSHPELTLASWSLTHNEQVQTIHSLPIRAGKVRTGRAVRPITASTSRSDVENNTAITNEEHDTFKESSETSKRPPRNATTKTTLSGFHVCPEPICRRHTAGFARIDRLKKHITLKHPHIPVDEGDEGSPLAQVSIGNSDEARKKLRCPLQDCKMHEMGFSRRDALKVHLAKQHEKTMEEYGL